MNLEELRKALRKVLDDLAAYKELKKEERSEDLRAEMQANLVKAKELEQEIREMEELEAIEVRNPQKNNGPVPGDSNSGPLIQVQDAPIYRGRNALGQQMVDIAAMATPNVDASAARSRFEKVVNREKALAEKRAAGTGGMVVGISTDGGILLQGETSTELITNGFNNSVVLSRAQQRDIGQSQYVELIGIDETSRASGSRGGGVRVYTDDELDLITQSKTKFKKIRLEPKRLTGMYFASNEILNNASLLQGEMSSLFGEEFAFKGQDLCVNGTGAGQALGILAAGCTVSKSKETGQAAKTIVFENLVGMKSRFFSRNTAAAVWVANRDIEPQLFTLSLPVGTGGSVMPVYVPSQDVTSGMAGTLMGIPIVFIEQCATLGTVGDIILCDWSAYWVATKGGVESASSIHLKFDYNQTTFRFIWYFDGQPRLTSAILPYKANTNSDRVSPFVTLAVRA